MPKGIILKGIGGFYYVKTEDGIIECKARGKFRKNSVIPMVGDQVDVLLSKTDATKGSIEEIFPRTTELVRPPVSNVDQAVIVVAVASPNPNLVLVDSFLIAAEAQKLNIVLCLNKVDLVEENKYMELYQIYHNAGYRVVCTSTKENIGIKELRQQLVGKITVFAGVSGVGKSSLLNAIDSRFSLQTGEVSKKIKRGKHTTRHVELLELDKKSYVVDTPGFSSIDIKDVGKDELSLYFQEFIPYLSLCKFRGCSHTSEPKCGVIEAVNKGEISQSRYQNYIHFYNQLKDIKEWQR